jgi:enoyl-CoA hydratase/carnithine racemase
LAKRISEKGPLAVKKAKAVIRSIFEPALHNGLRAEVEGFLELFASRDREEGMRAFLQKRAPVFEGR